MSKELENWENRYPRSGHESGLANELRSLCHDGRSEKDRLLDEELDRMLSVGADSPPSDKQPVGAAVGTSRGDAEPDAPTSFPLSDVSALPQAVDLRGQLSVLVGELRVHGDYRRIRDEYCRISILLNLDGFWAPAFRPAVKPGKAKGHNVYFEIHRDQLVIDCHWLHSKKERVKARDDGYMPLFNHRHEFPFELAWKFAREEWTAKHRADESLMLTSRQQCQLAAIRGKRVDGRFAAALDGGKNSRGRVPPKVAALRQQLNEWGERNKGIVKHLDDYEHLWLSREVLGTDAPVSQIVELFALVTGKTPKDEKTVREKLKTLDRQTVGRVASE